MPQGAAGGPMIFKGCADAVQLTSQANITSTGQDATLAVGVDAQRPHSAFVLELNVTSAATAVGDTLDVFVQTKFDTVNFVDVQHFTQILGNGGPKTDVAKLIGAGSLTEFATSAALAAATQRNIYGDQWRVRWVVAGVTPIFAFAVWLIPM